jgi:hypothetical protein
VAPNQPTHNHQDDFSPGGTPKQASNTGVESAGNFGMLQRSYQKGPVLPDVSEPQAGTVVGKMKGGSSD